MRKHKQRNIHNQIKHDVCHFLEQDENSRLAPGKKDTKTMNKDKRQKRFLNDTLQNLHKKFINESPYSHFCQFRPFWVVHLETDLWSVKARSDIECGYRSMGCKSQECH